MPPATSEAIRIAVLRRLFLLVEPEQPLLGTVQLEALPYRHADISKFYPYGDVSFPE